MNEEKIFSISEYVRKVNFGLKNFRAKITGEVCEVKIWSSGHVYFSLKDEKDGSVINCIIWKGRYRIYGLELKDGMKIVTMGEPQLYAPTGRFSFICQTIELAGEGMLKQEYERLKEKLSKEGVFENERKVPFLSRKIGLITSKQGAVLADFLNNLGGFGFKVKMIDSRVEGQIAVADLLSAIELFKKEDIEVLIIMRGGGSMESLMAFNNEMLAKEVFRFPAPVIAAIGHHKDMPLAALASDTAVSTPSIAARLLSKSWEEAAFFLEKKENGIIAKYEEAVRKKRELLSTFIETIYERKSFIFKAYEEAVAKVKFSFQKFGFSLKNVNIGLEGSWRSMVEKFDASLFQANKKIIHEEKLINFNNPERNLKLGYSIARRKGKVIRSVKEVEEGDNVDITLKDGDIISKVLKNEKRD